MFGPDDEPEDLEALEAAEEESRYYDLDLQPEEGNEALSEVNDWDEDGAELEA
jgi:hypothetical protein